MPGRTSPRSAISSGPTTSRRRDASRRSTFSDGMSGRGDKISSSPIARATPCRARRRAFPPRRPGHSPRSRRWALGIGCGRRLCGYRRGAERGRLGAGHRPISRDRRRVRVQRRRCRGGEFVSKTSSRRQGNSIWRESDCCTTQPRAPTLPPVGGEGLCLAERGSGVGGTMRNWRHCGDVEARPNSAGAQVAGRTRTTSIDQALIAADAWRRGEHGVRLVPPPGAATRRHPPRQRAGRVGACGCVVQQAIALLSERAQRAGGIPQRKMARARSDKRVPSSAASCW